MLSSEIAQIRRTQFGRKIEQLGAPQKALFDEALKADLAAVGARPTLTQGVFPLGGSRVTARQHSNPYRPPYGLQNLPAASPEISSRAAARPGPS